MPGFGSGNNALGLNRPARRVNRRCAASFLPEDGPGCKKKKIVYNLKKFEEEQ
jgi:hypothetical protein